MLSALVHVACVLLGWTLKYIKFPNLKPERISSNGLPEYFCKQWRKLCTSIESLCLCLLFKILQSSPVITQHKTYVFKRQWTFLPYKICLLLNAHKQKKPVITGCNKSLLQKKKKKVFKDKSYSYVHILTHTHTHSVWGLFFTVWLMTVEADAKSSCVPAREGVSPKV